MASEELWTASDDHTSERKQKGISALRLSILFACGAIALALVVTPMVAGDPYQNMAYSPNGAYDHLTTSSVGDRAVAAPSKSIQPFPKNLDKNSSVAKSYTIRRSITQTSNEQCVIYDDGSKTVGCK